MGVKKHKKNNIKSTKGLVFSPHFVYFYTIKASSTAEVIFNAGGFTSFDLPERESADHYFH